VENVSYEITLRNVKSEYSIFVGKFVSSEDTKLLNSVYDRRMLSERTVKIVCGRMWMDSSGSV
jgi:hypothetical protein